MTPKEKQQLHELAVQYSNRSKSLYEDAYYYRRHLIEGMKSKKDELPFEQKQTITRKFDEAKIAETAAFLAYEASTK